MNDCVKIWCNNFNEKIMVRNLLYENNLLDWKLRERLYDVPMGFIIEDGKLRQTKSEMIFNKCKSQKISAIDFSLNVKLKIGDMVEITNNWDTYSRYSQWHGLGDYKTKFKRDDVPTNGKIYKVVGMDTHTQNSTSIIILIQDTETEQVYIMGQIGIRKVD